KGDKSGAIAHWREAGKLQDGLAYNEPADWYYPGGESLGAALLRDGKATDAEAGVREDLRQNPRNPGSLFGLQTALTEQGKTFDGVWVRRQYESAWKNADVTLSVETM